MNLAQQPVVMNVRKQSSSFSFPSVLLGLLHLLPEHLRTGIANRSDQGIEARVGPLIHEDRHQSLSQEQDRPQHKAAIDGHVLNERQRVLQREDGKAGQHHEDLKERNLDDDIDEDGRALRRLHASGVAESTADEVPEELAEEYAPVSCPNRVDRRSDRDKSRPVVPDKVTHC